MPASLAEGYRQKAVACLRLSQSRNDPASKALLLTMAQEWMKLADLYVVRSVAKFLFYFAAQISSSARGPILAHERHLPR